MINSNSSSFLVGRELSSIYIPEIIYFNQGNFNSQYVTNNFDFYNNRASVVADKNIHSYDLNFWRKQEEMLDDGGWASYFDTGTIMNCKSYNEVSPNNLTLQQDIIQYDHQEEFINDQANWDSYQSFIFPVMGLEPNNYKYLHILYRFLYNDPQKRKTYSYLHAFDRQSLTSITTRGVQGRTINSKYWYEETIDFPNYSSYSEPHDFYISFCLGFQAIDSYDTPNGYIFEIKKIWFNNIPRIRQY